MKSAVCLKSGPSDIRRSKRHGPLEWILKRFFIVPWRCMFCYNRFFRPHFGSFTRREIPKLWPHVGDVPHCVEVVLSVYDPVLRYDAWIATLHCAGPLENPGQPPKQIRPGLFSRKCSSAVSLSCDSKAPALSANRMYFPGVPVLLWSRSDVTFRRM